MLRYVLLFFIKIYQKTLSLDHGLLGKIIPGQRVCIFTPSCSEYSYQSILKYGSIKGSFMSIGRIIRCGPWSAGGYDPVP